MNSAFLYRQSVAIIILAAFFAQTFSGTFIIADYYTNSVKYAKNCINKARPKMHCNGKCQMMKKLQEEEKKERDNSERKQDNKNESALSTKSFFATVMPQQATTLILTTIFPHYTGHSVDRSLDIFHPPQA